MHRVTRRVALRTGAVTLAAPALIGWGAVQGDSDWRRSQDERTAVAAEVTPRGQIEPAVSVRLARVIVPGAPGTSPDLAARFVAEALSRHSGYSIAVDNRPGADGLLAMQAFLAARPGEALFGSYFSALTVTPLLHERLPFDPISDFVPICRTAVDFFVLCVPAAMPVWSMRELVGYASTRAGGLNWFAPPGSPYLSSALASL